MKVLLDTHTFLWYIEGSSSLSHQAREVIESPKHDLYLSIVSLWEIAIKLGLGKLQLQNPFHELQEVAEQLNIKILLISFADTECYLGLPLHHRDPFDRMLIAQAINYSLVLVSQDTAFDAYSIQRVWS